MRCRQAASSVRIAPCRCSARAGWAWSTRPRRSRPAGASRSRYCRAERRRDVDRDRFQREGRLAASLNHPHCVFVFGAWEIDGELVIAMELMRDTLAEWRKRPEPLLSTAAVDAGLELIAGLDAAAHAGILHRDVKPSNCFVDDDGRVKIGDFRISISAHVRTIRRSARRGYGSWVRRRTRPRSSSAAEPLDSRSDIYGVGATLYELVTGHVPFEREDLMALLMAVANDAPRAPHLVDPDHPARAERRSSSAAWRRNPTGDTTATTRWRPRSRPYSSSAPHAAPLSRRAVAGLIDVAILALPLVAYAFGPLLADGADRGP